METRIPQVISSEIAAAFDSRLELRNVLDTKRRAPQWLVRALSTSLENCNPTRLMWISARFHACAKPEVSKKGQRQRTPSGFLDEQTITHGSVRRASGFVLVHDTDTARNSGILRDIHKRERPNS